LAPDFQRWNMQFLPAWSIAEAVLNILLVDSDEEYLHNFEEMIHRDCGAADPIRIERATNHDQATAKLTGDDFDVCFVEDTPASGSGSGLVGAVEKFHLRTAFIFVSNQASKNAAYAALRHGAMDYLVKANIDSFGLVKSLAFSLFRKSQEMELRAATLHDSLTGLGNRALFREQASKLIQHAKRAQEQVAVLFMDVDGLKPINDRFGHQAGDAVLQQVAARLIERTRASDIVARVGGDEFIALLARVNGPRAVARMAGDLSRAITDHPFAIAGQDIRVGLSCGSALYPRDAQDIDELVRMADKRMYDAKARNKKSRLDTAMIWLRSESKRQRP
jgi:diguanylate cyclase (GGDEF)-like protein